MNIGICDDNQIHLDFLYHMVNAFFTDRTDIFIYKITPDNLLIERGEFSYDIFITDIDMGDINGIDLVKRINNYRPSCIIIFVSNYLNFATEVYEVSHIYFVLKTEAETYLPKALDKAVSAFFEQYKPSLSFSYQGIAYTLSYMDILYLEALGRYLFIHGLQHTYKCIKPLKTIASELNDAFVRCHHSYIVNLNYVRSISRNHCIITTDIDIPVSSTYLKTFQSAYRKYISKKLM